MGTANRLTITSGVVLALLASPHTQVRDGSIQTQVGTADFVSTLVERLDLERYKAAIRCLAQFGDRREGTDRNRAALAWIGEQLRSYGCAPERFSYEFMPAAVSTPPLPALPRQIGRDIRTSCN